MQIWASGASEQLTQGDFEVVLPINENYRLAEIAADRGIEVQRRQQLAQEKLNNSERSARALFLSEVAERFDNRATLSASITRRPELRARAIGDAYLSSQIEAFL